MNAKKSSRQLAVELLERSSYGVQMAAVLSDGHGNFAWGWNYPSADGMTVHAEQYAVSRANPKRLTGARMTVAGRRKKSGNWVYSRPCEQKCLPLLRALGIAEIEFINKEGDWELQRLDWVRVPLEAGRPKAAVAAPLARRLLTGRGR